MKIMTKELKVGTGILILLLLQTNFICQASDNSLNESYKPFILGKCNANTLNLFNTFPDPPEYVLLSVNISHMAIVSLIIDADIYNDKYQRISNKEIIPQSKGSYKYNLSANSVSFTMLYPENLYWYNKLKEPFPTELDYLSIKGVYKLSFQNFTELNVDRLDVSFSDTDTHKVNVHLSISTMVAENLELYYGHPTSLEYGYYMEYMTVPGNYSFTIDARDIYLEINGDNGSVISGFYLLEDLGIVKITTYPLFFIIGLFSVVLYRFITKKRKL